MTIYKTACPHCNAAFQITTEQLQLRDGRARCGNCSKIFQADQNLITDGSAPTPQPSAQASINNTAAVQTTQTQTAANMTSLEAAADGLDDMDSLFDDPDLKRSVTKTQELAIPSDTLIDDNLDIDDHSDNDDVFDEDTFSLSDDLTAEFSISSGRFDAVTQEQLVGDADKPKNDEWIEQLLSEDGDSSQVNYNPRTSTAEEQPEDLISFLEDIGANTAQFSAVQPHQLTQEIETSQKNAKPSKDNQQKRLQRVQKTKQKNSSNLSSFILWGLLCTLLLVTLAAQYFYFNFDSLSRDTNKRGQLEAVCGVVGCDIPMIDAAKIDISKTTRFQDDSDPKKTRIKFALTNKADSTMLLPNIQVDLKKQGKIIASDVIAPETYLIANYKRLPRSQPISGDILLHKSIKSFDSYKLTPLY